MDRWFFIFLVGFLGAGGEVVLTIENKDYSLRQFYAHYPKKQWVIADSVKKNDVFTDFILRELCILEAKKQGLENDPIIAVEIHGRLQQLLVNESYEQLVALPLINPDYIVDARTFSRTELFLNHILVGYSGANLMNPPKRTTDDALILAQNIKNDFIEGGDFGALAEKYSDDPSAFRNSGALGWVQWGQWGATVPEFQYAAFRLDENVLSDPVLTAFGYHLILVTGSRPSDYQFMSDEEYEVAIINLSKGSVRDKLRGAAIAYDSLQIEKHGVYFNNDAVLKIVRSFGLKQKESTISNRMNINVVDFLDSITDIGVVCVYAGRGYGPRWFANKIKRIPASRQPDLDSEDRIISVFKTIILQDIALRNGYLLEVDNSISYRQRKNDIISDILYNAYLKSLLSSVPVPDTSDVWQYYNKNMAEKYMDMGSVLIREIRVAGRSLADSLLALVNAGSDFDLIAREYSLVNPDKGGLLEPFSKNKNQALFNASTLLLPGEISPVLAMPGNQFSIILLEEKISGKPLDFDRVYSRIEAVLTKEWGDAAKRGGVDSLINKYSIHRHFGALVQ